MRENWFSEKINKTDNPIAGLTDRGREGGRKEIQINKIRYEKGKGDITTNITEVQVSLGTILKNYMLTN